MSEAADEMWGDASWDQMHGREPLGFPIGLLTNVVPEITISRYANPAQRHEDAALFGPRVACELYWANHPVYGTEWTRQVLLDVKRQRARELREAGYWECFLDRADVGCGILLYAYGERLAKALSAILGLDYCLPGEGWLNDEDWMRSYELGWGEVLRYRLVGFLRCRRLRMRIASGVRRVLRGNGGEQT